MYPPVQLFLIICTQVNNCLETPLYISIPNPIIWLVGTKYLSHSESLQLRTLLLRYHWQITAIWLVTQSIFPYAQSRKMHLFIDDPYRTVLTISTKSLPGWDALLKTSVTSTTDWLKRKAGGQGVRTSWFTSMKNLIYYQVQTVYKSTVLSDTTMIKLAGVKRVVDLCAAPGSWSQVLSKRLK